MFCMLHFVPFARSKMVSQGLESELEFIVDPFMLSCWACLCHDLLATVKRDTTLTLTDVRKLLSEKTADVLEAAQAHQNQNIDGGIPVALCPVNLLMPLLKAAYPQSVRMKKSASNASIEDFEATSGASNAGPLCSEVAAAEAGAGRAAQTQTPPGASQSTPNKHRLRWVAPVLQGGVSGCGQQVSINGSNASSVADCSDDDGSPKSDVSHNSKPAKLAAAEASKASAAPTEFSPGSNLTFKRPASCCNLLPTKKSRSRAQASRKRSSSTQAKQLPKSKKKTLQKRSRKRHR